MKCSNSNQGEEEAQEQEQQQMQLRQSPVRPHQQQLQQHQLNELIEPLAKLNSHNTSPSKSTLGSASLSSSLRPKDLSANLSSASNTTTSPTPFLNCNNISPPQQKSPHHMNNSTNSNANWNSDSWADGEFEPIDEPITGK